MSLQSEILAIGKFSILDNLDCLDYSRLTYEEIDENTIIISTIAQAHTNDESRELAKMCGVDVWDFANHKLKFPLGLCQDRSRMIGEDTAGTIMDNLIDLLKKECTVFYMPNG